MRIWVVALLLAGCSQPVVDSIIPDAAPGIAIAEDLTEPTEVRVQVFYAGAPLPDAHVAAFTSETAIGSLMMFNFQDHEVHVVAHGQATENGTVRLFLEAGVPVHIAVGGLPDITTGGLVDIVPIAGQVVDVDVVLVPSELDFDAAAQFATGTGTRHVCAPAVPDTTVSMQELMPYFIGTTATLAWDNTGRYADLQPALGLADAPTEYLGGDERNLAGRQSEHLEVGHSIFQLRPDFMAAGAIDFCALTDEPVPTDVPFHFAGRLRFFGNNFFDFQGDEHAH